MPNFDEIVYGQEGCWSANKANKMDNIAVLVVSCDNYSDLWLPFFSLFKRFWPDCPFSVYLLTNDKDFSYPGVSTIRIGKDVSWSDNIKEGLRQLQEEYVLMFIEDLFLLKSVDTNEITRVCGEFVRLNGNYLRLNPTVKADKKYNEYFGKVSKGTIYRTSTVLSLWNKDVLSDLLQTGENAWEFEIFGTVRSDTYEGFYATWKNCFTIVNGVIKGKWERKAYRKIKSLYPDAELEGRRKMTYFEQILLLVKIARTRVLNLMPSRQRRKIKDFMLSGKYNYRLHENILKKS